MISLEKLTEEQATNDNARHKANEVSKGNHKINLDIVQYLSYHSILLV
jgi:hypothetical protein